ncbi:MAG: HD family hydrolase [archaeon GB-1867-035]|nr:HD family hydrolase [Candidatus Culexmicrobium profundum]
MKLSVFEALDRLGKLKRTGWILSKIPYDLAENVAEHTIKVAVISLHIARILNEKQAMNIEKILKMALIHDFPEAIISDIPRPIKIKMGDKELNEISLQALEDLLSKLECNSELIELFKEFIRGESLEAKIVILADTAATYLQCIVYETEYGIKTSYLKEIKEATYSRLLKYLKEMNLTLDDLLRHITS